MTAGNPAEFTLTDGINGEFNPEPCSPAAVPDLLLVASPSLWLRRDRSSTADSKTHISELKRPDERSGITPCALSSSRGRKTSIRSSLLRDAWRSGRKLESEWTSSCTNTPPSFRENLPFVQNLNLEEEVWKPKAVSGASVAVGNGRLVTTVTVQPRFLSASFKSSPGD